LESISKENIKKGTTTIGLVCKDGIILAADKRATGGFILDKEVQKIHKVANNIIVTMAGTASDAQMIIKIIKAQLKLNEIRLSKEESNVKEAANLLAHIVYNNIRKFSTIPGIAHFIMGGKDLEGIFLYDIYPDGTLSLKYDYVSSGSGSIFALGVLDTLYKDGLSIKEGIELVTKAMNAALQRDLYTGDGLDIWTVTKEGIKEVLHKKIEVKV